MERVVILTLLVAIQLIGVSHGHGRILDPPGRSSMWRRGFEAPRNDNDNGLNCGGQGVSIKLTLR